MKQLLHLFIFLTFFPAISFSQNTFYWYKGKKVNVVKDNSKQIAYINDNSNISLESNRASINKTSHSKRLGSYLILENTTKELNRINNINFKSDCFISELGDTLFPTPLIIVKFKEGFSQANIESILRENNVLHQSTNYQVEIFKIQNIQKVFKVANQIYQTGFVEWCRPNFIRKTEQKTTLNDRQYYIHNKYHYCGAYNNDINIIEAWTITEGCDNIRVAVLDDGVEDHPALQDLNGNSRVVNGYSIPNLPANGRPGQYGKHGQVCAGIIAATHSDDIRGVAPNVIIVPVNLGFEYHDELEWFDAMNWAWDPDGGNADVLSNSWGPGSGSYGNELYIEAIHNAQTYGRGGDFDNNIPGLGAIVVFSSGNNGLSQVSDYAKAAIAVGALNKYDTPAESIYKIASDKRYTNIGPNQDLMAYGGDVECDFWRSDCPGDIRSIDRTGNSGYVSGDYIDTFSGTSAACPQVSGAAALLLSINPNLTRTEVEQILFSTATDLGATGRDNTYGYGKLNVHQACLKAIRSLDKKFELADNSLSYSKTDSNAKMSFVGSPGCGVASGIYWCDIYKVEGVIPQTSVYVGDGLSGNNPNTGEYNVSSSKVGNNMSITTFFYYIKTNVLGQPINKWVPQNPTNSWSRRYCSLPVENIIFNGTINIGENKELIASESILLSSGFDVKLGASFRAAPSCINTELTCLPNPVQSLALKSRDMGQQKLISPNEQLLVSQFKDFKVYPNPNNGYFTINILEELDENAEINIYDINGTLKFNTPLKANNQNLVFSEFPGVYFIKIVNGENIYNKKIVIQ